jgi:hypothetical protein
MKGKLFILIAFLVLLHFSIAKHFQKAINKHKYLISDKDCVNKCLTIENAKNCGKVFVGCCRVCLKFLYTEWCVDERIDLHC